MVSDYSRVWFSDLEMQISAVALLCLSVSLGIISVSMLLNKYRVLLSRQLFGAALLTSCLSTAIIGGVEYFGGSILVSLILMRNILAILSTTETGNQGSFRCFKAN